MGWGLPGILRYLPQPSLVPRPNLFKTLEGLAPGARILDVGAGGRRITPNVITLDFMPRAGVDIVGDIHQMPIADNSFDCVVCTGTLEHIRDPWQAVREIHRVLRPGGVAYIDVPFMQAYHLDPVDYWRFTIDGLRLLCARFKELEAGVHIGPSCGMYWLLREYFDSCITSNRYIGRSMLIVVAYLLAPIRYLDYILIKNPLAYKMASALFFRGEKPKPQA